MVILRDVPLDELDRAIIHALMLDGRAPFNQLADVLGVSQQTVARRYRRMRSDGTLRVVGMTDPRRTGGVQWFVRLHCTPDAALKVADALARRNDTSWVQLTSGGTEIVCIVRTSGGAPDTLLLQQLPRTPRVVSVSAHCLLRTFVGGPVAWHWAAAVLTPDQIRQLTPPPPAEPPTDISADEALLAHLSHDGRTPFADLATAAGIPEPTVRRRVRQLRRSGALYFDVDIDAAALGYTAQALLWLAVPQTALATVAEALSQQREVAFAAATTGTTNLVANVLCRDVDALYTYLTAEISTISGVGHVETAPVIRTIKRAATPARTPEGAR